MSERQFIPFEFDTIPLSKSAVHAYEQCPWRFKCQVVDDIQFEVTGPMKRGRVLHEALHDLYLDIMDSGEMQEIIEIEDADFMEEVYHKHLPVHPMIENFIAMEKSRFDYVKDKRLFFPAEGSDGELLLERYLVDEEINFFGTMDRVDKDEYGDYIVTDYKFGKCHEWLMSKYRFEMVGYMHLLKKSKLVDRAPRYFSVWFMADGHVLYEPPHTNSITAFFRKIEKVRSGVRKKLFPKKTGFLCQYCPYAMLKHNDGIVCDMDAEQSE